MRTIPIMATFPRVEFPLHSSAEQAAGQPRQYLHSRLNSASVGSFSAAAISSDWKQLLFRRNVRGCYVNYRTPCLPLCSPNTRTPYDPTPSPVATSPLSQVTYLQWNYRDVYVPPPLLCQLLSEATTLDRQTEEYDPLLGSAVASLNYRHRTCLFYASGPLLETLTCGVVVFSQHSLSLREIEGLQLPGRILEVQVSRSQGQVFVCARTCYHVAFFQGPTEEEVLSAASDTESPAAPPNMMTLLAIFQTDSCVASVTVSPYIAGEGLVVMETGGIYMWNQGETLQVMREPLTTPSLSGPSHFWRCCYGNHPRSVVLAEHSGVSLCDLRSNKMTLSPLLTSPSEWLPNKPLVSAICPSPSHPHYLHISSSHSLLLLDLRQPRWPLLDQSHDLGHTPQMLSTAASHSLSSKEPKELVMVTDTVARDNLVFTVATPTGTPPFVSSAAHSVARYSELETTWQGKSALPLIGHRLRLPVGGTCIFALGKDRSEGEEDNAETFAAVSMSIWGDLFYQLWSYCETPPTTTPTYSHDDVWVQEALLQEQELQVGREEWQDTAAPINFNPLLQYLDNDFSSVLCPSCLKWSSHPSLPSPLPTSTPSQAPPADQDTPTSSQAPPTNQSMPTSKAPPADQDTPTSSHAPPTNQATPTSLQAPPTQQRCSFCYERLVPLRARKLEQKLVSEGLLLGDTGVTMTTGDTTDITVATGDATGITMATRSRGLQQLRTHCVFREPGTDTPHHDHMFWEGWREGDDDDDETTSCSPEATPTQSQERAVEDRKPLTQTPSSSQQKSRNRKRGMGF